MPLDSGMSARTALNAYLALREMNLGLWQVADDGTAGA